MRFKCNLTYDEKIKAEYEWHRVFAWLPKRTNDGVCVWLEYCEARISDYDSNWAGELIEWEYRTI
jgi:hypothetical protein